MDVVADGCGAVSCAIQGADPGALSVEWTVDGAAAGSGATLAVADAARVQCFVEGDGFSAASPEIVAALPTLNIESVTLSPGFPVVGDELTCTPFGVAAGGCASPIEYSYTWQVDGEAAGEGPTLATDDLAHGARVTCAVEASQGDARGPATDSPEVLVVALPPGTPRVRVEAPDGADGEVLCEVVDEGGRT